MNLTNYQMQGSHARLAHSHERSLACPKRFTHRHGDSKSTGRPLVTGIRHSFQLACLSKQDLGAQSFSFIESAEAERSLRNTLAARSARQHLEQFRTPTEESVRMLEEMGERGREYVDRFKHTIEEPLDSASEAAGRIMGMENYHHPASRQPKHAAQQESAPWPVAVWGHQVPQPQVAVDRLEDMLHKTARIFMHPESSAAAACGRMMGKDNYEHPSTRGATTAATTATGPARRNEWTSLFRRF